MSGLSERTDRAPSVAPSDGPEEPAAELDADGGKPNFRERGRLRRRARYLRALKEVQLRDIGGFVLELSRFGSERPQLLDEKVAVASRTDRELRALELLLNEFRPVRELREAGIGGSCPSCRAVHGSADRFCASCGRALQDGAGDRQPQRHEAEDAP